MTAPLWHSRFPDRQADETFEAMNASIGFDRRLFRQEIAGTRAHVVALHQAGIYSDAERDQVVSALTQIESDLADRTWDPSVYEDIHTAVEQRLTELTGAAGAKIQTGRSRNEQTVLAERLFLKTAVDDLAAKLFSVQSALLDQAEANVDALLPGYTHARPAQPIRFAHYLCAFFFGLERDKERLLDAKKRIDRCPSGVAALAGAGFGLDRDFLAQELGFAAPSENALDTVSDRDGAIEVLAALSILMVRLSRLAEDLILFSSPAFGFVDLPDTYCTSSSLMPQKKNPDALELIRGKTGRAIGDLNALLVTCKGLPTGYQKDLQEDKEALFDAVDTAAQCLVVCAGVVRGLRTNLEAMRAAITDDCLATDAADRLVEQGTPFRDAYGIVAEHFAANDRGRPGPEESSGLQELTPEDCVERRNGIGGTARQAVLAQIRQARAILAP